MIKTEVIYSLEFSNRFNLLLQSNNEGAELFICEDSDLSIINYLNSVTDNKIIIKRVASDLLKEKINQTFIDDIDPDKTYDNNKENTTSQVVLQINSIIAESIASRASDIHFEPYQEKMICRSRIDGILIKKEVIPKDKISEIVSRLKIMANLDIAEKRRPQDGRIRFNYQSRAIDIRVSVIPTDFGEKVVLRLLDKKSLRLDLNNLGFTSEQLSLFKEKIHLPNGIILVTGPTGSGKTTTLYAALNNLKSDEINISTVEDPIEYNLDGINQTQIKPEIDVTFAYMLRSLLRQDPNILMVGEIRDSETLKVAIQAALTGHLVLSTVHTNNAVATLSRLIDMGGEKLLLSTTIKLIIAQRLLRKNCSYCIVDGLDENNLVTARKLKMNLNSSIKHSVGCDKCSYTGFIGRTAIYELLDINDTIKQAITDNLSEVEIQNIAKNHGYMSMLQTSEELVNNGLTTPLEVLREINI